MLVKGVVEPQGPLLDRRGLPRPGDVGHPGAARADQVLDDGHGPGKVVHQMDDVAPMGRRPVHITQGIFTDADMDGVLPWLSPTISSPSTLRWRSMKARSSRRSTIPQASAIMAENSRCSTTDCAPITSGMAKTVHHRVSDQDPDNAAPPAHQALGHEVRRVGQVPGALGGPVSWCLPKCGHAR